MDQSHKSGKAARRTPRRIFQRASGLLCVGEYSVVQALQISEGGMLLSTSNEFAIGSAIVVSLLVPNSDPIVARAHLIYSNPGSGEQREDAFQYGVKFDNLPLHQRRMIRNYVSAKTQAEAETEVDDFKTNNSSPSNS